MRLIKNYYFLIFPGLILFFLMLLDFLPFTQGIGLKLIIAVGFAYLLSPRIKVIKKLHSKQKQLRWFFSKKIIYIVFKE